MEIISKLLDGVPKTDRHPVLVIDCVPNRLLVPMSNECQKNSHGTKPIHMEESHVFVQDLLSKKQFQASPSPVRFAEWSSACLQMQLEELTSDGYSGPSVTYMGIFLEDDCSMCRSLETNVAGKLMSNWWDHSSEAGARRRPEPIPTLEVLTIGDDQTCKNLWCI